VIACETGLVTQLRSTDPAAIELARRTGPGLDNDALAAALNDARHRTGTGQPFDATSAGRAGGGCRLITTLTDPGRYPAADLAVLYHERWETETAYLELKSTILGGRVLRARTPDGIEQEIYALLVTYQALRTAIADAASTVPGTDPGRASFTIALNAARDQVILAAGVIAGTPADLAGKIGRLVLAALMTARRLRISPRVVKRALSRYNGHRALLDQLWVSRRPPRPGRPLVHPVPDRSRAGLRDWAGSSAHQHRSRSCSPRRCRPLWV
jgi:hypothetical protein